MLLLLALLSASGCRHSSERSHPDAAASASAPSSSAGPCGPGSAASACPDASAAVASATAGGPLAPAASWQEALRSGDRQRAITLIEALAPTELERPRVRLALGRAALDVGDYRLAATTLQGLGAELPPLRERIDHWYALAAAEAGPHLDAARALARSSRVSDLVVAAQAYERGGDSKAARTTIDVAVTRAGRLRQRSDEVSARMVRAAMAERAKEGVVALLDLRWVVSTIPSSPQAPAALAAIHRLGGAMAVEAELEALARSATDERVDAALRRIDELGQSKKSAAPFVAMSRARALWQARRNTDAKAAFDAAARGVTPYAAEAAYFAARSAARAGDSPEALQRFAKLRASGRASPWSERAALQHAQLLLQLGRFAEAADAFAHASSPALRGDDSFTARLGRALALLGAGRPKPAKELLVALRKDKALSPVEQSTLRELEALAALRLGDRAGATRTWQELLREEPLTYASLVAHARLRSLGAQPLALLAPPGPAPAPLAPPAVALPAAPALLHDVGLDGYAEQELSALEDVVTASHPGRESEALCTLYAELSTARRRLQIGTRATSFDRLMRLPGARDRWTWSCVYPEPWAERAHALEARYSLPRGLVHAVMRQESAFRSDALSDAGAQGLMQLIPTTATRVARELGRTLGPGDVLRPDVNLELGAAYLGNLLRWFRGSVPLAVAAYNAGPIAVREWLRASEEREVDTWVARIPYEQTREYVARVLGNLARYQYLGGGGEAVVPIELELPAAVDVPADAY